MSGIYSLIRPFRSDGGHAFLGTVPPDALAKIHSGNFFVSLIENGVDLGPGNCPHSAIRELGRGRYSFWENTIWFSASDNSDCMDNGRRYSLLVVDVSERSALMRTVLDSAAPDDDILLKLISRNALVNNTVFGNFFRYRNAFREWQERLGIPLPRHAVDFGCGLLPWTGLRFLLEGTERFIATDLGKVQDAIPASTLRDLKATCEQLDGSLVRNWNAVVPAGNGQIKPNGLEARGEMAFEDIDIDHEVDLIISKGQLEHVTDMSRCYAKMAEVTPRGAHMFHSVDLRDHRFLDQNPLAFLALTEEDYAPIRTENRLRASQHRALLDQNGFDIIGERLYVIGADGSPVWVESGDDISPGVTQAQRERFQPEFRQLDLMDLSTISTQMVCRRR